MAEAREDAAAQMHFAVFMEANSNYHLAGWRLTRQLRRHRAQA